MCARIRLRSYKKGSKSAKALAEYLGIKQLKLENSRFIPKRRDIIINWGNSSSYYGDCVVLNSPSAVRLASNKIFTFQTLDRANISIPEFCLSKENVENLSSSKIVVRHTVTGHSGEGIEVLDKNAENIPIAPLYTGFIPKKNEYRVIATADKVIDIKQKRLASDAPEDRSRYIRNLSNGWVYARENLEYIEGLNEIALASIRALGLDFGAVDIISDRDNNLYVLEVNTAFGLEGTTIELFGEAIKELL